MVLFVFLLDISKNVLAVPRRRNQAPTPLPYLPLPLHIPMKRSSDILLTGTVHLITQQLVYRSARQRWRANSARTITRSNGSNKSLHPSAKTCVFSIGTQNSNVTVSNPKPRKKADVVGGTSLQFFSKINTFLSFFVCMSTSTVDIDRRPILFLYEPADMVDIDQFLGTMNRTDCRYRP